METRNESESLRQSSTTDKTKIQKHILVDDFFLF